MTKIEQLKCQNAVRLVVKSSLKSNSARRCVDGCLMQKNVKILYIDSNEAMAGMFRQIASQHAILECMTLSNGKRTVMQLMELSYVPSAIFVNCNFQDIPCKALVEFIRKQQHLASARLILIADYLSNKEMRTFRICGVDKFVLSKFDIQAIRAAMHSLVSGEW